MCLHVACTKVIYTYIHHSHSGVKLNFEDEVEGSHEWIQYWWSLMTKLTVGFLIFLCRIIFCGPRSSFSIATDYGLDGVGVKSHWGRDFLPAQTDPGAHPASCTMGTGSFLGVKCGWGVLLTTQPLLAPRTWKSKAILLPTLWATTRPVTGLLYFHPEFFCQNWVNLWKSIVSTAAPADIWTGHLMNTNYNCYSLSQLSQLRMTVKWGIHVIINLYLLSCGTFRLKPKILTGLLLNFLVERESTFSGALMQLEGYCLSCCCV